MTGRSHRHTTIPLGTNQQGRSHNGLPHCIVTVTKAKEIMAHRFNGIDVCRATSLFEYGFIAQKHTSSYPDEYFIIYDQGNEVYGTTFLRESELDSLIKGKSWADEESVASMLASCGETKEEWLGRPFILKVMDCLSQWGQLDILGTDYWGMTEKEVRRKYRHLF